MSRSKRQPIIKDKGLNTQEYWKPIRSKLKQMVNRIKYDEFIELILPHPKTIINDYNKCDYVFRPWNEEQKEEWSRK